MMYVANFTREKVGDEGAPGASAPCSVQAGQRHAALCRPSASDGAARTTAPPHPFHRLPHLPILGQGWFFGRRVADGRPSSIAAHAAHLSAPLRMRVPPSPPPPPACMHGIGDFTHHSPPPVHHCHAPCGARPPPLPRGRLRSPQEPACGAIARWTMQQLAPDVAEAEVGGGRAHLRRPRRRRATPRTSLRRHARCAPPSQPPRRARRRPFNRSKRQRGARCRPTR